MTKETSTIVRDALAARRAWRRLGWDDFAPTKDLTYVRRNRARKGADHYFREFGLPAYMPDRPLPLP